MKVLRIMPVRRGPGALLGAALMQCLAIAPARAAPRERPTDFEINSAVEGKLSYDSSLPFNEIDVNTEAGIVIFSGTVSNMLTKERAAAIAESVRGVRSVVNGLNVQSVSRTDDQIRKDVEAALLGDPATGSYQVNSSVKGGVVKLTGIVNSWQERKLAVSVAMGVRGVRGVANDTTVVYKTNHPDGEIAAEVRATLKRDVWVDELLMSESVKEGNVTLSGTVGSAAEKTRADEDAYVSGVKSVNDVDLRVEPWDKDKMLKPTKYAIRSDEEIKKAVKDALLFDPRVLSFNPIVTARNGAVVLTGTVDNLKSKRAAGQDAKNTVGVWRVRNLLKIRGKNRPTNGALAQNVKDALLRDPFLDRYQIGVDALSGTVYLAGAVDSFYEKSHAEDVASRVKSVAAVNNNLTVSFPDSTYARAYNEEFDAPYYSRPRAYSGWRYASDAAVKDGIESELFWSTLVDGESVQVAVNNGVATLTGAVDSWREYDAAAANAWEGGARDVVNNLKIKGIDLKGG